MIKEKWCWARCKKCGQPMVRFNQSASVKNMMVYCKSCKSTYVVNVENLKITYVL